MKGDRTFAFLDSILAETEASRSSGIGWDVRCLREIIDGLRAAAKFHEGDRVQIRPGWVLDLDKSPGWSRGKGYLIAGSRGTVVSVDHVHKGSGFACYVTFDGEGSELAAWRIAEVAAGRKPRERHTHLYGFHENNLVPEPSTVALAPIHAPEQRNPA